jgi:hypothetical protein
MFLTVDFSFVSSAGNVNCILCCGIDSEIAALSPGEKQVVLNFPYVYFVREIWKVMSKKKV